MVGGGERQTRPWVLFRGVGRGRGGGGGGTGVGGRVVVCGWGVCVVGMERFTGWGLRLCLSESSVICNTGCLPSFSDIC